MISRVHTGEGTRDVVLIIDDDDDFAAVLGQHLEGDGYCVVIAATGRQGIERALGEPTPDLILMDLVLPDLTGREVYRLLREGRRDRQIPIIICSGFGQRREQADLLEMGAEDCVVKPFSARELSLRIRAVLRRSSRTT